MKVSTTGAFAAAAVEKMRIASATEPRIVPGAS